MEANEKLKSRLESLESAIPILTNKNARLEEAVARFRDENAKLTEDINQFKTRCERSSTRFTDNVQGYERGLEIGS